MINFPSSPKAKDQALEQVQKELDEAKKTNRTDRFYCIFVFIILIDIFTFPRMSTWASPLCIAILELLLLIGLGRKLEVDYIWTLTEKIVNRWNGGKT